MQGRCKVCGDLFEKTHHSQVYCSEECRSRAKKVQDHVSQIRRQQKQKEEKANTLSKCEYCGQDFVKTHGNQKYCSDECKESRKLEQDAYASMKYYYKTKKRGGDKVWGLGSGGLGPHSHDDFEVEKEKISKEMKRLGLNS